MFYIWNCMWRYIDTIYFITWRPEIHITNVIRAPFNTTADAKTLFTRPNALYGSSMIQKITISYLLPVLGLHTYGYEVYGNQVNQRDTNLPFRTFSTPSNSTEMYVP